MNSSPLVVPAAVLLVLGCHLHIDGQMSYLVNGVRLDEQHREVLDVDLWSADALVVELSAGDARVEWTDGPTQIIAVLHEVTEFDAYLEFAGGRLTVETHSGEPARIGDLIVRTSCPLPRLILSSGLGDLTVEGVQIDGELSLSSGAGDVTVRSAGHPLEVELSTGMGDVAVRSLECPALAASTGMGDIALREVTAAVASVSSGMGDVELVLCSFEDLDASTGMGDIDTSGSRYERADLDSGLGSIRGRRD
jgi:hypothetical protein